MEKKLLRVLQVQGPLTHKALRTMMTGSRGQKTEDQVTDAIQVLLEGGQIRWNEKNELEVSP